MKVNVLWKLIIPSNLYREVDTRLILYFISYCISSVQFTSSFVASLMKILTLL